MTRKQRQVLTFIESYFKEHGIAPSHDEIIEGTDLKSKNCVYLAIKALCAMGKLVNTGAHTRRYEPFHLQDWTPVHAAAERVLDSIRKETGQYVTVDAGALGDLDIAVSEARDQKAAE